MFMCSHSEYLTGSTFAGKNEHFVRLREFAGKICDHFALRRIHHKSGIAHVAVTVNTHKLNNHTMVEGFMKE